MKVGLFNKRIWDQYSKIVSIFCGIVSFIVIFIDIPTAYRFKIGLSLLIILIILFFILLARANFITENTVVINNTKFVIKFGDLFSEQGLKTIAFNEYFDTLVDETLISSNTINGKFIKTKVSNVSQLDDMITNNIDCKRNIISFNESRTNGKKAKYKLGTSVRFEEYILFAFSHFDENNRAYLNLDDYLSCLTNYWIEVNRIYNGENVIVPLLGTGITRLACGNSISHQKALEIIIKTFEYSNLNFAHSFQVTLVLPKELKPEINLFNLEL